jgi:hypothetical protein
MSAQRTSVATVVNHGAVAAEHDAGAVEAAQSMLDDADLSFEPKRRRVRAAREHSVHCVVLRTSFERRSLLWRYRPTDRLDEPADGRSAPPDPWSIAAGPSTPGRAGNEQHPLADRALVVRCPPCGASGRITCSACNGSRKVATQVADHQNGGTTTLYSTCAYCRGTGISVCRSCDERGRTLATPVVVFETGVVSQVRTVDDGTVPTEIFVEVVDVELGGPSVLEEKGIEITRHRSPGGAGGYRDATGALPPRVITAVDALLAEDAVGGSWRPQSRALEVRQIPTYRVELDNGREAWLVGSPPKVLPETALDGKGGVLGWIASHIGLGTKDAG